MTEYFEKCIIVVILMRVEQRERGEKTSSLSNNINVIIHLFVLNEWMIRFAVSGWW